MLDVHAIFAALADPTRLRILSLVRGMELAMGELAEVLGQSQPRVSRHVRILAEAGLVHRHKEGAYVFVGPRRDAPLAEIHALIDRIQAGADLCTAERVRLAQVRADRQKAVDDWFDTHAAEWDLMRRMEGPDAAVDRKILEIVGTQCGRLLDIGTGTGRMLALLAPHAIQSVGVDRSPEMLRLARAKLSAGGLGEVRHADMRALPFADGDFDTVLMHQVLHFADDPATVVVEAARVVAGGGRLIIVDYHAHAHEDLRTRFQHLRLGFEETAVLQWLAAAGLRPRVAACVAGPELTSVFWEGTRP